mgnify:CR=1 FL=1
MLDEARKYMAGYDIVIESQPWTADIDVSAWDLITPLIAWGYHQDPLNWIAAMQRLKMRGARLANPAEILIWNTEKTYLRDLSERGVNIPPTLFVDSFGPAQLSEAWATFGGDALVVKPTISAGAHKTLVIKAGSGVNFDDAPTGATMIQPFLPAVAEEGEWSLLFFGGAFSHALLKTPKAGDFRSQPDYGSRMLYKAPDADVLALAEQVLTIIDADLLYARLDITRDLNGLPCLMEAELIEPDFFLAHAPEGGPNYARAFARALGLAVVEAAG